MSEYHNNSIFWVETTKIQPNPFQPRREFEPRSLEDLADSIRQYGVLQPLVVTRKESLRPDNEGMDVSYELIAGERRLRASKLAGLQQVPVIIRKETDDKVKLELAIIENLQREDLNPIDRAMAFNQLHKEFSLTHVEIGKRMGKSRVYVSNTLRLLSLPEEIKQGLMAGRITEGHTRPLLMLIDRPKEQTTLFKEIMVKKLSVRDAEKVARKIAQDKVRKKEFVVDPKIQKYEQELAENLGTRVHIEPKENGGQITIDYFTIKDLEQILSSMQKVEREQSMMESYLEKQTPTLTNAVPVNFAKEKPAMQEQKPTPLSDTSDKEKIYSALDITPVENSQNFINESLPKDENTSPDIETKNFEDKEFISNNLKNNDSVEVSTSVSNEFISEDNSEKINNQIHDENYSINIEKKQNFPKPKPKPKPEPEPEPENLYSVTQEKKVYPNQSGLQPQDQITLENNSIEIEKPVDLISQDQNPRNVQVNAEPQVYTEKTDINKQNPNEADRRSGQEHYPNTNQSQTYPNQQQQAPQTNRYYNNQYEQEAYYQQPPQKKKSFLGRLFG